MRIQSALAILTASCVLLLGPTAAQAYPDRPVRIIVPYAVGGFTDILARALSTRLSERLGQPVVVENKPGASTMLGADLVAKSAPDGHTLLMATTSTLSTNPLLFRKMPFRSSDFITVALTGLTPFMLVAHPSVNASDVKSLVAWARANPGKLNLAMLGVGSSTHLVDEMFRAAAKVDIPDVAYKGSGPATTDLLAGHVQLSFDAIATALPRVRAGQLKALGVTSEARVALAGDVPTFRESGLPQMVAYSWYGLLAPAGTPAAVIEQLNRTVNDLLKQPDLQAQLEASGASAPLLNPRQFAELIDEHTRTWARVIRPLNIQLD